MKIFAFTLAAIASAVVCLIYVDLDKVGLAALWGATTGIWIGNVVHAIVEEIG